jgi:hypothetical protein
MVFKSRWIIWAGHVSYTVQIINEYRILEGNSKGRRPLGDFSVNGRIIIKWILKLQGVSVRIGFSWLSTGSSGELL